MPSMKKILGYVFIVLGCFLSLCLTFFLLGEIPNFIRLVIAGGSYNWGVVIGELLFSVIFLGLIVLLLRTGIKWVKRRKVETTDEVIDTY
jgi:hypothetical protein